MENGAKNYSFQVVNSYFEQHFKSQLQKQDFLKACWIMGG